MSGIVGILNLDGAPVDRALLSRMMEFMTYRGPDAQETWVDGNVGFGHTLFRTTEESEHERQPFTLDGRVWIVADARVDARRELIGKLKSQGYPEVSSVTADVELILRAYQVWGENCVEHLLGDFAFAVWDGPNERLFCARDHMGVKPFYYAHLGNTVIFSNTLDCLRQHPAVSDTLNDLAIADFLLFGLNQERDTTSFADIQRIPPAHRVIWSPNGLSVARYWTLPIEEPVYFKRSRDYTDRFENLLRQAVGDRLRVGRVSVFMSGGLDSPLLAATAADLLPVPAAVHAFTAVYDRLIPDSERHYAGLVAQYLGIPIQFFPMDEQIAWVAPGERITPEPHGNVATPGPVLRYHAAAAAHSRIAFYGEGPDNALAYEWRPYLAWLAGQRRWGRLLLDIAAHVRDHRRIPLLPTVPRMFQEWRGRKQWEPVFPNWLNPELVQQLQLRERWEGFYRGNHSVHPIRPAGYSSLQSPLWQGFFESLQPPYTNTLLEVRHPYVDIRMLQFLLRIPALPWCRRKLLIRRVLRGIVPEPVLHRPKTALTRNPDYAQAAFLGLPNAAASRRLSAYGNLSRLPKQLSRSVTSFCVDLRFTALNQWLHTLDSSTIHAHEKGDQCHESKCNVAPKSQERVLGAGAPDLRHAVPSYNDHKRHQRRRQRYAGQ